MVLAELLAIGSAALTFVSATASAALDVAKAIFDLLTKFTDWTLQATQQLFTFASQQPLAFTLVFGTALILFIALPFVTGISYTSLLFGNTETVYEERAALPTTIMNYTDAELAAMINNIHLAQLENVPRVQTLIQDTDQNAFLGTRSFALKLFPDLAKQEMQYLATGSTLPEIQQSWKQNRYESCGALAHAAPNESVWELVIKPISPDLTKQFQAAAANANLRFYNVTLSCYKALINCTSETNVPGATKEEQVYTLQQMIANGTVCSDESLGSLSNMQTTTAQTSPIPIVSILARYWNALVHLWKPVTAAPSNATENCYIILNNATRERMYADKPFWLTDTPDANLTVQFFYKDLVLKDTRLSVDEAAALKVIGFPVTTSSTTGLLDIPAGSYRVLKSTTIAATGGATTSMFDWFETGITILALLIIGTAGVIMVHSISKINERR